MRILLVEDNPDHIFLARQAIEETWHGATLHIARDLAEVRALLCQPDLPARFDLLLAALDSREADRLAQLREIHAPALHDVPIIALVSSTRDQELARVAEQPIDQIILKPLRAEALREALRRRLLPKE